MLTIYTRSETMTNFDNVEFRPLTVMKPAKDLNISFGIVFLTHLISWYVNEKGDIAGRGVFVQVPRDLLSPLTEDHFALVQHIPANLRYFESSVNQERGGH